MGSDGIVSCSLSPWAPGSAVFTLVVNINPAVQGGSVIPNQAVLNATDATGPITLTAPTTTTVLSPATVSGTKSAAGTFAQGSNVTYTVVLTNSSTHNQGDNPGAEFTDILPAGLTLVSATATSGTATATVATNTVTWNGSIAAGASVTITINATVDPGVPVGTTITNQGTIAYDADGNGTNEASAMTDDPGAAGPGNPTVFVVVAGGATVDIPTLDEVGLAALVALLALGGTALLRRRRA